ncbi:hypothetical protein Acsp06_59670 [Actinomycetospora sp. NBRC 106375]|nr:hypothetical protein Acsp06_59670 [Actinomycetospora sp. NBRC 106375]
MRLASGITDGQPADNLYRCATHNLLRGDRRYPQFLRTVRRDAEIDIALQRVFDILGWRSTERPPRTGAPNRRADGE